MYSSIFITGFRATGKTTIGREVAQRLGWRFFDSDVFISERAGMTVAELTAQGTDWKLFRQMEVDFLKEIATQQNVVLAMGGGACVNDVVHEASGKTFGEIGKEIVSQINNAFVVLLTASETVVSDRIREEESRVGGAGTVRPMLDSNLAQQIQGMDASQITNEVILHSLKIWRERQSLYAQLTDNVLDTSKFSVEECTEKILEWLQGGNKFSL
ncbi:shikimate kinase [Candidatus Gracilibacteria bacterium]|nr:shikimate kinase [Candidatus Gracilibacteria bacterium]